MNGRADILNERIHNISSWKDGFKNDGEYVNACWGFLITNVASGSESRDLMRNGYVLFLYTYLLSKPLEKHI